MLRHFYRKFDFSPQFVFEKPPEKPATPAAAPATAPTTAPAAAPAEKAMAAARRVEEVRAREATERPRAELNAFVTRLLIQAGMTIEVGSEIRERFADKVFAFFSSFRKAYGDWLNADSNLKFKFPAELANMQNKSPEEKQEALFNFVFSKFGGILSSGEASAEDVTSTFLRDFVEGDVSTEAKANLQKIFEAYLEGLSQAIQETKREWKLSRLSVEFQTIFQEWSQQEVLTMDGTGTLGVDAQKLTKLLEGKPEEERQKIMGDLEALRQAYNQQQEEGEKVGGILAKGGILAGLMEMLKTLFEWLKSWGAQLGIKPEKEEKPQTAAGATGEQPTEGAPATAEAEADTPEEKTIVFLKEQLSLDPDEIAFLNGARVAQILKGELKPPENFDKDRWPKLIELLKKNEAEKAAGTNVDQKTFAFFQEKFEKKEAPKKLT